MIKKIAFIALCMLQSTVFAAENHHLSVILDWYVNPNHAPLLVAEQQGFFKQQGLSVEIIPPATPDDGPKLVAADKASIAVTYQPALLLQVTHGLPVMRFATLVNQPLDCLIALDNIHSLKDLKGKTVGYSSAGTDAVMLGTMLKFSGMSLKDVNLINVKYDLTQALLAQKVDAFTGAMRNFEPFQIQLAGKTPHVFYPEKYGFPQYDELIFITHRKHVHDPDLAKFTEALKQGVAYLIRHPESSWQTFAKNHPELNNELNKKAWFASIPYFDKNPGELNAVKYDNFAKYMENKHQIASIPPLTSYAINIRPEA